VGLTPGHPFVFLIPATGEGPLTYSAESLPDGLTLDANTGVISGAVAKEGTTLARLEVRGARGKTTRTLKIVAAPHSLALTPPMGWNSWNIWGREVDEAKIRDAADCFVASGLAAHGYQYINIDDCWQGKRDENGEIQVNPDRFSDMKALGDYIHQKGLRFGLYTSPGPLTCADCEGSLGHEEQDVQTYARWGVDYLKYDWCSYGVTGARLDRIQEPYRLVFAALDKCGRDIVLSMSEGGMGAPWTWAGELGANLWRNTGDIHDDWGRISRIGSMHGDLGKYPRPGHWNDPDMLVVGQVKWRGQHPTRLTPDEQITHISLWALIAAPLLIGCDLAKLDPFTLALLTNDEVLDIDQDPLGKAASRVADQGIDAMVRQLVQGTCLEGALGGPQGPWGQIWARPLWDGALAVGLCNFGDSPGPFTADWATLGLHGPQPVRDLWLQKDLGVVDGSFTATVPPHGVVLVKIGKPSTRDE
jgi:alpha-galactosidase